MIAKRHKMTSKTIKQSQLVKKTTTKPQNQLQRAATNFRDKEHCRETQNDHKEM